MFLEWYKEYDQVIDVGRVGWEGWMVEMNFMVVMIGCLKVGFIRCFFEYIWSVVVRVFLSGEMFYDIVIIFVKMVVVLYDV